MSQVLDSVPEEHNEKLICCYVNATSKMQVARITNIPNWYFERVVFPGQHLVFEAALDAHLEIHTGMMASSIISDVIPCVQIQVQDQSPTIPSWLPKKPVTPDEVVITKIVS